MPDREKVIKGLEKLRNDLGYGLPDRSNVVIEYLNSLTDAIALLKDQEPVSVMGPDIYEEYWAREAICPDCGTHWMSYDKNGKRVTKYCPGCGRRVKWQ